jgi:hypothetical protein
MTFHMVERVDEVFARALLAPERQSITLESMLRQEVARVKRRAQRKKAASGRKRTGLGRKRP